MACRKLRIGVFFDGTNNCRDDRELRTNVAKLYDLYRELEDEPCKKSSGRLSTFKLYAVGVGQGRKGRKKGYIGDGFKDEGVKELVAGAGGARRVYEMVDRVCEILDAHPYDTSDPNMFTKREIDLFGFSRGAATARDFVNTFIKDKVNKDDENYGDVRFNFIGLFDTVGSFGVPGNDIDMKPKDGFENEVDEAEGFIEGVAKYKLNGSMDLEHTEGRILHKELFSKKEEAKKRAAELKTRWERVDLLPYYPPTPVPQPFPSGYMVVAQADASMVYENYNFHMNANQTKGGIHFTAGEEVRLNFPLTDTRHGIKEISLLGVHSDIGGGYGPKDRERLLLPVRGLSEEEMAKRFRFGWREVRKRGGPGMLERKRVVTNTLSDAALYLMHKEALLYDVPLDEPDIADDPLIKGYIEHIERGNRAAEFEKRDHIVEYMAHQSATHPAFDRVYPYPLREAEDLAEKLAYSNVANIEEDRVERDIYRNSPSKGVVPKG